MDKKSLIKDYFNFTRKERIAVLIITGLFILILLLPVITKRAAAGMDIKEDSAWNAALHQLKNGNADTMSDDNIRTVYADRNIRTEANASTSAPDLFYFDPNTISAGQWKRLGIKEKTINTIKNYLSKGGVFRRPEDLQKIYGLSQEQYNSLAPYIKIKTSVNDYYPERLEKDNAINAFRVSSHASNIDINTADSTAFISLPGIGTKLAARIITFRDKLGGFYSVDQISETYGLRDSVYQKIKPYLRCNDNIVKKININTVTKDELKTHPYIRWNIANAIIEYRNQHGSFISLDDLKKINALDIATLDKITHYLSL